MTRILAVDDSPSMRKMVSVTLTSAGYEVLEAADGREVLDLAKGLPPVDLVITDVNMPNMDGITLVRELRLLPHYRGVPLLVLTTEAGTEKKAEGKAASATGWVVKPFSPDRRELLDMVLPPIQGARSLSRAARDEHAAQGTIELF
jgi:two-component system, chemotaxis family, chemotaxis protein CheY